MGRPWRVETPIVGDFADSINDRMSRQMLADEIYIGLDDLDPGSLHIRRRVRVATLLVQSLRFKKADINLRTSPGLSA